MMKPVSVDATATMPKSLYEVLVYIRDFWTTELTAHPTVCQRIRVSKSIHKHHDGTSTGAALQARAAYAPPKLAKLTHGQALLEIKQHTRRLPLQFERETQLTIAPYCNL